MKEKYYLEDLSGLPVVRKKVDNFIRNHNFITPYETYKFENIAKRISHRFEKLIGEICKDFEVEAGLIKAYFTADKLIYPRVSRFLATVS